MTVVIGGRYSGAEGYARERYPGCPVVTGYETRIREQLRNGNDPQREAETFLETLPEDAVLVLTEMGCGIVPAEREERLFREMNGRINCLFAAHAQHVIRVTAGIGQELR